MKTTLIIFLIILVSCQKYNEQVHKTRIENFINDFYSDFLLIDTVDNELMIILEDSSKIFEKRAKLIKRCFFEDDDEEFIKKQLEYNSKYKMMNEFDLNVRLKSKEKFNKEILDLMNSKDMTGSLGEIFSEKEHVRSIAESGLPVISEDGFTVFMNSLWYDDFPYAMLGAVYWLKDTSGNWFPKPSCYQSENMIKTDKGWIRNE